MLDGFVNARSALYALLTAINRLWFYLGDPKIGRLLHAKPDDVTSCNGSSLVLYRVVSRRSLEKKHCFSFTRLVGILTKQII